MRVLHIIDSGGLYGAETMLLGLVREQRRMGLDAAILSLGNIDQGEKPVELAARQRGIPVQTLRMRTGLNLLGTAAILRRVREQEIDLIHTHGYKGNILMGLVPRRWRRVPVVSTVHGWTSAKVPSRLALYQWLDRRMLAHLDAVVLVNNILQHDRRLNKVVAENRLVIENGLDLDWLSSLESRRDSSAIYDGKFVVGAIGRLAPEKGFNFLIQALQLVRASCPAVHAFILGEGPDRAVLQQQIDSAGLHEVVELVGYQSDIRVWMRDFNVFVLSSITEGLPMTLLEAMSARVPIIATNVGGIPEALGRGQGGILIQPASPTQLASAIERIYRGEVTVQTMMEYSHERMRAKYSCGRMAARYLGVYRNLLAIP